MSDLTKITVVGRTRRATLVVPADEPLGAHVAEIARLLEQPSARPALTTSYGEQLDLALAPADQGVLDGTVLRLLEVAQLPAPPEVTDVTDRVAELRDEAPGVWDERHALVAAAIALGVLGAAAGVTLSTVVDGWAAAVLLVVTTLAATLAALGRQRAVSTLLLGAALGATVPAAGWLATVTADLASPTLTGTASLVVGLAWLVIAAGIGLGRRSTAATLGAVVGILLTAGVITPPLFGVGIAQTAGVVAALGVLVLGLLPPLAVATSGLASLDDEVIAGRLPGRDRVAASLAEAFRVTGWAVVAVAVWLGPAVAVLLSSGELWPMLLGGAVAVVAMLRTRVLPMAVPSWALWLAAFGGVAVGVGSAPGIPDAVRLAVAAGAAVAVAALALVRPSVQTRIRLRRLGDVTETLAAVAIVPFLLGAFGVYGFLLEVFA
jgi:hypothetical protein